MKLLILALAMLFLIPLAYAFDCNYFSGSLKEDCIELQSINESLIPNLLYTSDASPDHDAIRDYNDAIDIDPIQTYNQGNIRNAWLEVPYIYPSILDDGKLTAEMFQFRGDYDYSYYVPPTYYNNNKRDGATCRIYYDLNSRSSNLGIYSNERKLSDNFNSYFSISRDSEFKVQVDFSVTIRERYYEWDRYCCRRRDGRCVRYCWDCDYDYTNYDTDALSLSKDFSIASYDNPSEPSFKYIYEYSGSYWGNLSEYDGNLQLNIGDDYFNRDRYSYYARFIDSYDYIQLYATPNNFTSSRGIFYDSGLLITDEKDDCSLEFQDFFNSYSKSCDADIKPIPVEDIKRFEASSSWNLLYKIIVFIFINIILYKVIRKYWKNI